MSDKRNTISYKKKKEVEKLPFEPEFDRKFREKKEESRLQKLLRKLDVPSPEGPYSDAPDIVTEAKEAGMQKLDKLLEAVGKKAERKEKGKLGPYYEDSLKEGELAKEAIRTTADLSLPGSKEEMALGMLPILRMGKLFPKAKGPRDTLRILEKPPIERINKLTDKELDDKVKRWLSHMDQEDIREGLASLKKQGKITDKQFIEIWRPGMKERLLRKAKERAKVSPERLDDLGRPKAGGAVDPNTLEGWVRKQHIASMPHEHIHKTIFKTKKYGEDVPDILTLEINRKLGQDIIDPINKLFNKTGRYGRIVDPAGRVLEDRRSLRKYEFLSWIDNIVATGKHGKRALDDKLDMKKVFDSEEEFRDWQREAKKKFGEVVKWLNNMDETELKRIVNTHRRTSKREGQEAAKEMLDFMKPIKD